MSPTTKEKGEALRALHEGEAFVIPNRLIDELVSEFRISGNQDSAFDNLAAERLGVSRTDLHCLNTIENNGGMTAGELAEAVGLTTGAVTGVIDRLERVGFARRVSDPADRRRVKVEVTPKFYSRADRIWGPLAADWVSRLGDHFTAQQLQTVTEFLRATNEVGRKHQDRLKKMG
jgi:DNA-binding MarR family transcriptional regulator